MNVSEQGMNQEKSVMVGSYRIGPNEPVFMIAEAGVNHDGSLQKALQLVEVAADAGADAVKFQMFRAAELVTADAPMAAYQRVGSKANSQRAMLFELELSLDHFHAISDRCRNLGIMFLATTFSVEDVSRAVELGVRGVKIASTDLSNACLRDTVIATGLPVIQSTGASTQSEIHECIDRYGQAGAADRLVLLHCVSSYPAPLEVVNFRALAALQKAFHVPVGFSDHTTSIHTGGWAVAAGAVVLEKHFTLDRSSSGPDHAMSLSPTELRDYVDLARQCTRARGDGSLGMRACEKEVRRVASKSIVSSVAIPRGTCLTPDMLTLKRPGTGIPWKDLARIEGKPVCVDVPADTLLTWEMVQ